MTFVGRKQRWQKHSEKRMLECFGTWAAVADAYRKYLTIGSGSFSAEFGPLVGDRYPGPASEVARGERAHNLGYFEKKEEEGRTSAEAARPNLGQSDPSTGQSF